VAADQDNAQKTEEPTPKKLDDAAKKGDTARSQEVRHWFMFVGIALALSTSAGWLASGIKDILGGVIAESWQISMDGAGLISYLFMILKNVAIYLSVPIGIFVVAGLAGSVVQHKPVFSTEKIAPKLSKISLAQGFKRLFSIQSLMEFVKTVLKFVIVTIVAIAIIWPERDFLITIITSTPQDILVTVMYLSMKLVIGVVAIMTLVAAADYTFQRFQFTKRMRMTKQEIKDEHKQLDGDPHVKARIRQIRNERSRRRMMADVPNASVVITNPTHYAVALQYEHGNLQIPKVLAKGVDFMALKIREVAKTHNIPIVENPALARVLYATVELDEEVPPEQYKAVAQVISYIMKLKGKGHRRKKIQAGNSM
jgi:flagellar biosynthesis protein FlhB